VLSDSPMTANTRPGARVRARTLGLICESPSRRLGRLALARREPGLIPTNGESASGAHERHYGEEYQHCDQWERERFSFHEVRHPDTLPAGGLR
jgi:hypothetical protein